MARRPSLDFTHTSPLQLLEAAESLPDTPATLDDHPLVTPFDLEFGFPVVFRTREGGVGLLELRKSPDFPTGSLGVRYKTLRRSP